MYDSEVCEDMFTLRENITGTRGHNKKIFKERARLNIRKYSFCQRVVNNWNDLPLHVINSDSVKKFESKLDKVWAYQDQKYNYREKIKSISRPTTDTPVNEQLEENDELETQA